MSNTRTFSHAFSGGEVSSELFGRFDLTRVAQAAAALRNFVATPHGPAKNRAGTEFVQEVYDSTKKTRLINFSYNNTQNFAIQLAAGVFSFHLFGGTLQVNSSAPPAWSNSTQYYQGDTVTNAAQLWVAKASSLNVTPVAGASWRLLAWQAGDAYAIGDLCTNGGYLWYAKTTSTGVTPVAGANWFQIGATGTAVPYRMPNPFAVGDIFDIHYTQSADVMTLVHPTYPVQELRRLGPQCWVLSQPSFSTKMPIPSGTHAPVVTPTGTGSTGYSYVATHVSLSNPSEESQASAAVTCTNDLTIAGHYNVIGADITFNIPIYQDFGYANVYKLSNGIYGYIGRASLSGLGQGWSLIDNNITPDVSRTPPTPDLTFSSGPGYYPAAVGYVEQRRAFAGWTAGPQNFLGTKSGTESNTNFHVPTVADDRIAFKVAAREASAIRHIVPLQDMILLSATNEFRVASSDGGALTGANVSVKPQAYIGANNVQPVVVGRALLYAAARGGRVREMTYAGPYYGYYTTNDVSTFAPHLFDYFNVTDMAFAKAPYPILWCINDQGALLGMTYVPEEQISGWHRHDTDGTFESCCVVTEQGEDYLYVIVNRSINGSTKRYVERMRSRNFATRADAFFVDCGATYNGSPTTTITGLTWLEGKTVSILADGGVQPPRTVTGGSITLQDAASKVQIGLPITADIQTLPVVVATPDYGQGRVKNLNKAWLRVKDSLGILAGPSFSSLRPFASRSVEPYGTAPALMNDEEEIVLDNAWNSGGQVCIRQTDPLPLTVVAATLEVAIGG